MFFKAIDARTGTIVRFDCDRVITWAAKLTGSGNDAEFTIYLATDGAPPLMTHFYCILQDVETIDKELIAATQRLEGSAVAVDNSKVPTKL